jgi:hypothetical protein
LSNPATAILTQTKRFPLIWDDLTTPLTTWRALLPETRDPRHAPWCDSDDWVIKPALGRVGEGVGLREIVDSKEMRRIAHTLVVVLAMGSLEVDVRRMAKAAASETEDRLREAEGGVLQTRI